MITQNIVHECSENFGEGQLSDKEHFNEILGLIRIRIWIQDYFSTIHY